MSNDPNKDRVKVVTIKAVAWFLCVSVAGIFAAVLRHDLNSQEALAAFTQIMDMVENLLMIAIGGAAGGTAGFAAGKLKKP